jgi:hypothetical protein
VSLFLKEKEIFSVGDLKLQQKYHENITGFVSSHRNLCHSTTGLSATEGRSKSSNR